MLKKKKTQQTHKNKEKRSEVHRNATQKYGTKGLLITDLANGERILSAAKKAEKQLDLRCRLPQSSGIGTSYLGKWE